MTDAAKPATRTPTLRWRVLLVIVLAAIVPTVIVGVLAIVRARGDVEREVHRGALAHIRALGVALPFAIANAIFGGSAEYVALYRKDMGHERWFYIYLSALAAMSLVAYVRMRETKSNSLIEED